MRWTARVGAKYNRCGNRSWRLADSRFGGGRWERRPLWPQVWLRLRCSMDFFRGSMRFAARCRMWMVRCTRFLTIRCGSFRRVISFAMETRFVRRRDRMLWGVCWMDRWGKWGNAPTYLCLANGGGRRFILMEGGWFC